MRPQPCPLPLPRPPVEGVEEAGDDLLWSLLLPLLHPLLLYPYHIPAPTTSLPLSCLLVTKLSELRDLIEMRGEGGREEQTRSSSSSLLSSSSPCITKSSEVILPRVSVILPCSSESLSSLMESLLCLSSLFLSDLFQLLLESLTLTTMLVYISHLSYVLLSSLIVLIIAQT